MNFYAVLFCKLIFSYKSIEEDIVTRDTVTNPCYNKFSARLL